MALRFLVNWGYGQDRRFDKRKRKGTRNQDGPITIKAINHEPMTNTSLRERFGIDEKNAALASRLLTEAVEAGVILVRDPEAGTRNRTYLPFWVAASTVKGGIA